MKFVITTFNGLAMASCFFASMLNIKLYLAGLSAAVEFIMWLGVYLIAGFVFAIDSKFKARNMTPAESSFFLFTGMWVVIYPTIEYREFSRFFDITVAQLQSVF